MPIGSALFPLALGTASASAEAAQPYHAACSKGPPGKKAIARIDAVLDEPVNWHEFMAPLKEWFPQTDYERADRGVE